MTEFKTRDLRPSTGGFLLSLKQGDITNAGHLCYPDFIRSQVGDKVLSVSCDETFMLTVLRDDGYDRDNYPDYAEIEIELNEAEVRELLLTATVWLEQREPAPRKAFVTTAENLGKNWDGSPVAFEIKARCCTPGCEINAACCLGERGCFVRSEGPVFDD